MSEPMAGGAEADVNERLARLSPAKRALLERRLREAGKRLPKSLLIPEPVAVQPVLSFAQERMWFLHRLDPDRPVYNIPVVLHLRGKLDAGALEEALALIMKRHVVLRTRILDRGGQPTPIVADDKFELETVDLSKRKLGPDDHEVRELIETRAQRPFDLSGEPMLRATLVRLAAEEHILALCVHHIASDAWSMRILRHELAEFYSSFVERRPRELPILPIQYADYAKRQRDQLQGDNLERLLDYWKNRLAESPPVLRLPADYPRRPRQCFRGARESFAFDDDLATALERLSLQEGATNFMTLLAAFQVLLHRYTGEADICVGTPVTNRDAEDTENLIGLFVNTLVLRTDLAGDPGFRELLASVRGLTLEALAHQALPFERVVAELQPARDLSRSPWFQTMLSYQARPDRHVSFSGVSCRWLPIHNGTSKFDLTLAISHSRRSLSALIEYDRDLFATETIRRLAAHYRVLLRSIVRNPDQRISALNLLADSERQQLLFTWNDTRKDVPGICLHQLFEAQAKRTPDAPAVTWDGEDLSYAELNCRANRLAHHLRDLGVGPDVPVAIFLERSLALVVGVLAVLKAGGAYVPLDPSYPQARLAFMLEDCKPPVIVTQDGLRDRLPQSAAKTVCVSAEGQFEEAGETQDPVPLARPDNLAYIMYTSGSTGKPKGVCVEHRNVVALLDSVHSIFKAEELAGVLAATSLSFDISIFELFAPLSCGGKVILADNVLQLSELPARDQVTLINTVPSAMAALLSRGELPPNVRTVSLGGEKLEASLVRDVYRNGAIEHVFDLYGPTECTVYATFARRLPDGPVTIGRPIPNVRAYILDRHRKPVPVGVAGELYLGGAGVVRGYLRRPDLTAERFVPDPFDPESKGRLYKTGDLARYRADGDIEFLGRLDHQVKLRGFRIELEEIETHLAEHPGVRQATVVLRDANKVGARLVAFWEPHSAVEPASLDLQRFLRERVPEHMVPVQYVMLPTLPRTPSGKVNRSALPEVESPPGQQVSVFPRDRLEAELVRLWESVLENKTVGVTDSFFEIGGHSLLAVRLFSEIERVFGRRLPLATLFEAPTVEQLAGILRDTEWRPRWSSLVPIQPAGSKPPLFCVHEARGNVLFCAQLAQQLGPEQPLYGLQAVGLNGGAIPAIGIEEMATAYLAELRTVQPTGPYLLGGFCTGAYVALEMAIQLRKQGEDVALLASFNTDGGWKTVKRFVGGIHYHWLNLSRLAPEQRVGYVRSRALYRASRFKKVSVLAVCSFLSRAGVVSRDSHRQSRVEETIRAAAAEYRPGRYEGKVVYFQGSDDRFRDPRPFWCGLVKAELETHIVPGRGASIFREPNVSTLAQHLRRYLP